MKLSLDYETYCELNLKKVGLHKYVNHSSFEVICLSWAIDQEDPLLWLPWEPVPERLMAALTHPEVLIYAFNAGFERAVINRTYKLMGMIKPPSIVRYRCSMAIGCSYSYPQSLDNATQASGVAQKKDKRGQYLINKLCKPKKWSNSTPFTRWTPQNAPQDFADFYDYCKQDVRAERAFLNFLPRQELSPTEQIIWQHTIIQNDRGVHCDFPLAQQVLSVIDDWKQDLLIELSELTDGVITTGGQTARMKNYAAEHGIEMPDFGAETVIKFLAMDSVPLNVKQVLRYRQLLSKTSTAKFTKMLDARCWDDTVKGNMFYWGAITGRYGARGLQIQNLPRRNEKDPTALINAFWDGYEAVKAAFGNEIMSQASKLIRPCVISPPGEDLYVSDYSSIENRILHWCAGDEVTLEEFRQGLDQYKTFSADKYSIAYEAVTDQQRFYGKTAILGLGFQMGAGTYHATANSQGLVMSKEEATQTVSFYRNKYKLVKMLWEKLYAAAVYCVQTGRQTQYKLAKFAVVKDHLFMKLPNGRCLSYPQPRMIDDTMPWGEVKEVISFMGVNPYSKKWGRLKITPGRLTENLVQGAARDVVVQGALNVEKAGYKVIGSVHDEVISRAPEGFGSMEEFNQLICDMPAWAEGLPLAAEGYIAKRYRKD